MRGQKKNQKSFYYATWKERKSAVDEFGNITGDAVDVYNTPVQFLHLNQQGKAMQKKVHSV